MLVRELPFLRTGTGLGTFLNKLFGDRPEQEQGNKLFGDRPEPFLNSDRSRTFLAWLSGNRNKGRPS